MKLYGNTLVRQQKSRARRHTFELGGAGQNEWERQPGQSIQPIIGE